MTPILCPHASDVFAAVSRITSLINSGILAPKNSRLDFILRPKVRDFPAICYIRFQNLQAASSPQLQNPHTQKITPFRSRLACLQKLPIQDGKPSPRVTPPPHDLKTAAESVADRQLRVEKSNDASNLRENRRCTNAELRTCKKWRPMVHA